jgi:hypothetical protein
MKLMLILCSASGFVSTAVILHYVMWNDTRMQYAADNDRRIIIAFFMRHEGGVLVETKTVAGDALLLNQKFDQ